VVYQAAKEKKGKGGSEQLSPRQATLAALETLPELEGGGRDVSCKQLWESQAFGADCRTERPKIARLHDWHIDVWSQTSLLQSGPPVESWLHGQQDAEFPETAVAWRRDVEELASEEVEAEDRERVLARYPVTARERLKEPTRRVMAKLKEIVEGLASRNAAQPRCLVVTRSGTVWAGELGRVDEDDLAYGTLLLPPGVGGLSRGMLDTEATPDELYDVADEAGERVRYRALREEGEWVWCGMGSDEEVFRGNLSSFAREQGLRALTTVRFQESEEAGGGERMIGYFAKRGKESKRFEVDLDPHLEAVATRVQRAAEFLVGRGDDYRLAGQHHDEGKRYGLWQKAMGGDVNAPKAKTAGAANGRLLDGYRHELESAREKAEALRGRNLAGHITESHHGWARPHFEAKAYRRETLSESQEIALEA
ncbi:MAG TPA: hypothetical protein DEH78_32140, partial [Solibacterales bacterium]|nr:hypothetical protein [Bryobacterales bacterium]